MIRNSHPPIALRSATPAERPQRTAAAPSVYGAGFWGCYLSNTMLMLAVSLLFRYADFVSHVGGSERHLGVIVGVGMIGALAMRITLGMGIDRYGARPIWLGSLLLFIVASLAHTIIYSVHGPTVYLVRILMTIGVTGAVGASLTYVSLRVPENRVAEIVGTLGTSGFLGLALGPVLGDLLFSTTTVDRWQIDRMFILAAAASVVALLAAAVTTGGQLRRAGQRRAPALLPLVKRYHPGAILLVASAAGMGLGLPGVFVRAYAVDLSLPGIQTYFLVYAVVAICVRVATRRLTGSIGVRPVVLMGMTALTLSMLLYLTVRQTWQLAFPATVAGIAHALLFPAIVAGGTTSFPSRYRGLATTLVLGMFDIGSLIGQPAIGNTLYYAEQYGLPKYPTMFVAVALVMMLVALAYAFTSRNEVPITAGHRGVVRRLNVIAARRESEESLPVISAKRIARSPSVVAGAAHSENVSCDTAD